MKFTVEPPNPSYARNEGNATLVWDYSVDNAQVELEGIVYGVEFGGTFTNMLGRLYDGTVITFPTMPSAYKGRVRIEGRASLVIENINLQDNTAFMCTLFAKAGAGQDVVSIVQLIVTGMYYILGQLWVRVIRRGKYFHLNRLFLFYITILALYWHFFTSLLLVLLWWLHDIYRAEWRISQHFIQTYQPLENGEPVDVTIKDHEEIRDKHLNFNSIDPFSLGGLFPHFKQRPQLRRWKVTPNPSIFQTSSLNNGIYQNT